MRTQKIAISVPKHLVLIVDQLSHQNGISRSKFITNVLQEKIKEEQGQRLREVYNQIYSDEKIRKEQLETTQWFEGAETKEGQEW